MIGDLSRKKGKPGTYFALAFCVSLIAFVMMCAGVFTPYWSKVTENDGTDDFTYERGLVVTCDRPSKSGCNTDASFGSHSGEFLASFLMAIFAIILAFLALQLFILGQCVRSIRERNLGIPLTTLTILVALLIIASLALFEVSITNETTSGYSHVKDTFGFSRGILIGASILYFIAAFFSLGEYFKRQLPSGVEQSQYNNRQSGVFSIRQDSIHQHHNSKRSISRMDGHSDGKWRPY